MPAAANQSPAPNQSSILDTTRVQSTIPKAGSDDGSWVYPSPQMVRLINTKTSIHIVFRNHLLGRRDSLYSALPSSLSFLTIPI